MLLTGYGSYWSDELGDGLSVSQGLGRSFGRTNARLGYRYYRTTSVWNALRSHTLDGYITLPLRSGLRWSLQASAAWGTQLQSLRFYSGFWKTF